MPKVKRKGPGLANSVTSAPALKFEAYEQVFIGPFISTVIGFGIYLCKQYWEKSADITVYETIFFAVCLSGICLLLLYLPFLLYRAFSNKGYATIASLVIFLALGMLGGPIWHYFAAETQNTTLANSAGKLKPSESILTRQPEQHQRKQVENPLASEPDKLLSPVVDALVSIEFDGDCQEYSRQLLSQPNVLHYQQKHKVEGQVMMFERTIYLKGKPSFLVLSGDPSEYEGSALDILDRHHNTGARSNSVKDAVEKALIKMCQKLR